MGPMDRSALILTMETVRTLRMIGPPTYRIHRM